MFEPVSYSSSTTPAPAPVTVIWGFGNSWIPDGYDIKTLRRNIEVALKKRNPDFFIEELIAIGADSGDKYEAILTCPDINFKAIPRDVRRCEHITTELDVIMELYLTALQKKKYVLVIAGEVDLRGSIKDVQDDNGLHVMISRLEDSTGELHRGAKAIWIWKSDDPNKATMVNGGAPIRSIRG